MAIGLDAEDLDAEGLKGGCNVLEDKVSSASCSALELPSLLRVVACLATTDLGYGRLLALQPFSSLEALEAHRRHYEEARRLLVGQPLVRSRERPFVPLLAALESSGQTLSGKDLIELAALLEMAAEGAERIRNADPPCPALGELIEDLPPSDELRRLLKKTFDSRGEIREDATPRLAEIKRQLRLARQRVYGLLKTSLDEHRDDLEDTIPMRGGRLVLMMQAGAKGRMQGLTHGRSASGRSFYFEPLEVVEENNQLQQTSEEEEAEKRRILAEVIRRLRNSWPSIEAHVELVADLDHLQASVRFADACDGQLAAVGSRHELRLVGARHPLIDPALAHLRREALDTEGHRGAIVPLDVELSGQQRALVVTGPNAGGKTVALKTVGLLSLAHQCGLPIPAAAGTAIPFFESIVATVGDDQDLLADRSTFSGRLLRLKEVWEKADEASLVLLDELGSGTDPDEGAALSTAILESLIERRGLVFITTHLSQVAAVALERDGAYCAAMLFDSRSGKPTYRLLPGPPGGSEAIALARRLGLPEQWLRRAEDLLGSDHRDLRRLLVEIEHSRRQLAEAQVRLDEELADAVSLRQRLADQESELRRERKTVGQRLSRELEAFRQKVQRSLAEEVESVRQEAQQGRKKGVAAAATKKLFEEAPVLEPEVPRTEVALAVGGTVRHQRLGWQGVLEKLDRGKAQVRVQGKIFSCREKELVGLAASDDGSSRSKSSSPAQSRRQARHRASEPSSTVTSEIKLIGQRVEPAIESLDRFLDQALLASHAKVRVVHGHGTGRLRSAVREHLKGHGAVAAYRPGNADEGGDGATLVELVG